MSEFTIPDCPDCGCVQDGHCLCIPSKPPMAYNGWTNYATWNVNLWIENKERLYRAKQRWLRYIGPVDAFDVENFYLAEMGGTTPDLATRSDNEPINFAEIAEHWESERKELQT